MSTTVQIHRRTTDIAGGIGLIIGGAMWLFGALHLRTPVFFSNPVPSTIAALFVLAGATILAVGIGGEPGIVGGSMVGKVALILFGARNLVLGIFGRIVFDQGALSPARYVGAALVVLFAVAALVAMRSVWRAGLVTKPSRAVLLVVALLFAIATVLTLIQLIDVALFLSATRVSEILAIALVVLGITYLAQNPNTRR